MAKDRFTCRWEPVAAGALFGASPGDGMVARHGCDRTTRLVAEVLGAIAVHDHLVVGSGGYVSLVKPGWQ